jgi:hypothetical protein
LDGALQEAIIGVQVKVDEVFVAEFEATHFHTR